MTDNRPPDDTSPGGDATQPASPDDTETRVTPPAATWESSGATTPPPGAPPPPPPGAASPGPRPPSTRSGGGVPLPAFIAVAVVAVAALVFGIFMFLGKNSEADKKEDAQEELASAQRELRLANDEIDAANEDIADLEANLDAIGGELTDVEDFAAALDEVLGTGAVAADSLYDCSVTAYEFILNFLDTGTPDVGQAEAVDDRCFSAEDNYNAFIDALSQLE